LLLLYPSPKLEYTLFELITEEKRMKQAVLQRIPPLFHLAVVLLNTGMRPHNLISLLWKQIHWSERLIYIPKGEFKTNKEAYFPINDTVMKILEGLRFYDLKHTLGTMMIGAGMKAFLIHKRL
jgi:integrase